MPTEMNTNSNTYTIIYASVMVVIVAFLLAFVSSALKSKQDKNIELDTKKQILSALNVRDIKDADAEYNKIIKADMLLNQDGSLSENAQGFTTAFEKEAKENNKLLYKSINMMNSNNRQILDEKIKIVENKKTTYPLLGK